MNFIFGKALLSLLFYTDNLYFFTTFSIFVFLLFPYFSVDGHLKACMTYIMKYWTRRAYSGFEIVVANSLTKWKKVEPKEINFSQGFSHKVASTSCFEFNSLPARGDFCCLLITFANSLDPDQARQMSGLIWIQIVWHPDGIEKIQYPKSKIWYNDKVSRNNKNNIWKSKSWSKYTFSQICNFWTTFM